MATAAVAAAPSESPGEGYCGGRRGIRLLLGSFPAAWAGKSGAKREGRIASGANGREDDEVAGGLVGTALPERAARWAAALRKSRSRAAGRATFPPVRSTRSKRHLALFRAPRGEQKGRVCVFPEEQGALFFLAAACLGAKKRKKKKRKASNRTTRTVVTGFSFPKLGNDLQGFLLEVQNRAKVIAERNTQGVDAQQQLSRLVPR